MKVKFNKFERVAGFFVLTALIGSMAGLILIAIKKGWFEVKVPYYTLLSNSEGVRPGSAVEMAGVKVGHVDRIQFTKANRIQARILLFRKYQERVKKDSTIQLIRPFVVGEKVMYLTLGTPGAPPLPEGSYIHSEEIFGLVDILNGRKLAPYVQTFSRAFNEIALIINKMLENKTSTQLLNAMEQFGPMMKQLTRMSFHVSKLTGQLTSDDRVGTVMRSLASSSNALNKVLPQLVGEQPGVGQDFAVLVKNLVVMTEEMKKLLPAISVVAPDLPQTSKRLIEAIDEAVIVLKAIQKSFLLRGSAREVRREEEKKKKKKRKENEDE